MSSELTVATVIVTGLLGYGYFHYNAKPGEQQQQPAAAVAAAASKKGKKKKQAVTESGDVTKKTPTVIPFPTVVPGGFATDTTSQVDTDAAGAPKAAKKSKKKKAAGKKAGTPIPDNQSEGSSAAAESVRPPAGQGKRRQSVQGDQGEAWTRVEPRRRQKGAAQEREGKLTAELTSDAGVTTSVTGNSSPASEDEDATPAPDTRRTLAEKMLPKGRKTGVDDMLETSDYPTVSRVMRVQPRADEKPVPGFSWGDYEDVHVAADDADGEDDGGWGVVRSRSRRSDKQEQEKTTSQPTESAAETKKQRQNAAKREAQKVAKAEAEAERLATLARHKRELEKTRIAEQYAQKSGKKSSNATASVDDRGHLVWD